MKVYAADFVETGEQRGGTGIVHIAPAFGEDDLKLGQEKNLPVLQHVGMDGVIKPEVPELAGLQAKPGDDPTKTDVEVVKYLAKQGTLFKKEKYTHSYPHDWRVGVPLLNYATSSWFIKVTDIKDQLIEANKNIGWVPKEIGTGRFGEWLENVRDWSVSRSRFWGTPLPIWKSEDGAVVSILGSLKDLKDKTRRNNYVAIRHGESENNVSNIVSAELLNKYNLTEKGKEEIKNAAQKLKDKNINLIVASPLLRTHQSAEILAAELGLNKEQIIFDERLHEIGLGDFEGKTHEEFLAAYKNNQTTFDSSFGNGESYYDMRNRIGEFMYEFDKTYEGKNVLIVTHSSCIWMLGCVAEGLSTEGCMTHKADMFKKIPTDAPQTAEILNADFVNVDFALIPHNDSYELDFHRPFIDRVMFTDKETGKLMKRIPDVFDTWFDSGSMPFASEHFPFKHGDDFNVPNSALFPADFISESLDQTRGWFYVLLVLSVALFGKGAYKNVPVSGLILAEDGKKMSKSLNNYPQVIPVVDKYGADALRLFLMASPAVRGEEVKFSEKGIDEVVKKVINRIDNILSFIDLYIDDEIAGILPTDPRTNNQSSSQKINSLDLWLCELVDELNFTVTNALDGFYIDKAARAYEPFLDNLSTWYVRRSRERLKKADESDANFEALKADRISSFQTLTYALHQFSLLVSPFMPFTAEYMYQKLQKRLPQFLTNESIHLENWPTAVDMATKHESSKNLLLQMKEVRDVVSLGLEARVKEGIKVRQPLKALFVRTDSYDLNGGEETLDLVSLIKDEVNIKEVIFDAEFDEDDKREVRLDIEITPELKIEGQVRELIRKIQEARKKSTLTPTDMAKLHVLANDRGMKFIGEHELELKQTALISHIDVFEYPVNENSEVNENESVIDDMQFVITVAA